MTTESRDDLIDAYFEALDTTDPSVARPALADSFVYESLAGDLHGHEGLREYITELRSVTDSTHDLDRRVHGESVSVVEGVVSGTGPDGRPAEAAFCDVFEFDDDESAITRIAVYTNDA